ncbi:nucleotidyltransferase family protein [bacterium]|nr:nucleotidyltransferase family protein [bacterium]
MARLLDELRQKKLEIQAIAESCHASNIRLFGSVARGEEQNDSDIDFLVDFQLGATLFDQVGLVEKLSKRFGRNVDVVSARSLNKYLRQNILNEAVKL